MAYIAQWLKDETVVAECRFEDLQEAKETAKRELPAYRSHSGATNALVRDDNGAIYFRAY